jgi:hypothetical protein
MLATMGNSQAGAELVVPWAAALGIERAAIAWVLRDVVRAPYRAIIFRAAWLAWNSGIVSRCARRIYESRDFERLPLLADALEDAGCTDAELLGHLRGPGPHVRGCWPLDHILSKE